MIDETLIKLRSEIRERVWKEIERSGEALPPYPVRGRIPNFKCSRKAAENLATTEEWRRTRTVKINPDSPQRPLRLRALIEGKTLVMPTPRLKRGFLLLDPRLIPQNRYREASTIRGSFKYGKLLSTLDEVVSLVPRIDMIVEGSVAVDLECNRLGKGEGYGDLEYAILSSIGKVSEDTPVATTVSELQIVERIPRLPHDLPLDIIATPRRVIRCRGKSERPKGIVFESLSEEKVREIPLLRELLQRG